jgi:predicted dehydrogenase/nucleoside-diphosphate-sugar epimerase
VANNIENNPLLVLGGGRVVSEFYLPALAGLGLINCAKVVDRAPEQLSKIAARWPELQVQVGDFRETLRQQESNNTRGAAIVALPNMFHVDACCLAVAAGYDVLCDKPLALQREACLFVYAAACQAGRIVDVNMCRRYLPSMLAMRRAIQDSLIGEIVSIDVEDGGPYAWSPTTAAPFAKKNGGVLADIGVHYLDLIEHVFGRLEPDAYRDDCAGGVEANAVLQLETETGVPVRIALSRTRDLQNRLVVRGSRGALTAFKDDFGSCLWTSNDGLNARLAAERPFVGDWAPNLLSCFAQKISDFLTAIHDRDAPIVSARDAASTIGIIEWAYAQRGRSISVGSALPRPESRPRIPTGRAVVTGGTGFIGSHLVGRLAELGFADVSVPIRSAGTCAEVARYPVSLERVSLLDLGRVRDAVEGARWVFHLAYGRDGIGADRITTDGTRNVVEAAIAARSECVVILSTIHVFGDADGVVDETHPYRPKGGRYGTDKAAMERWCLRRSSTSSPTRIVILNPSCVFGPGGKTYTELPHRLAKNGAFCWIDDGCGIANYCFIDNLVDAMVTAAGTPEAHGQRFIINDGTCPWRDFLGPFVGGDADRWRSFTAAQLAGLQHAARPRWSDALRAIASDRHVRDVLKARMPTSAAIAVARRLCPGLFDRFHTDDKTPTVTSAAQDAQLPLPPSWLADLFGPTRTCFNPARAHTVLGWRPAVTFKDGQNITMRWLRESELGVSCVTHSAAKDSVPCTQPG